MAVWRSMFIQLDRSEAIAGKPAPTGSWLASDGNFTDTTHLSAKKNARRNAWHFL
ncbi:UNVERIFIED_ORG: hypothetical protein J2Y76_003381 [Pseudomonas reinekei]|uniref:hypothetical protein n=1 Tax=Pseudomonas laurylsulfatiphila TaxID=2011015 RepID=UPI003D1EB322|nr:hypothetical protein [Pseudomonas reinekei]